MYNNVLKTEVLLASYLQNHRQQTSKQVVGEHQALVVAEVLRMEHHSVENLRHP